jgi:transcription antitermination factor NusG
MKVIGKKKQYWFAVYTKPRCEKKVHALFEANRWVSYCPMTKTQKKWSDRYKMVEEPLFKSYVFIYIQENQISEVRMLDGVVNFVYWLGQPARIRESEILTIRKFMHEYRDVRAERLEIIPGQRVVVNSGLMMDREGSVIKVFKNKVVVALEDIGFRLVAELDPQHLNLITS